jgi:ATP-dependent Clp protease adaptor protein ClpS
MSDTALKPQAQTRDKPATDEPRQWSVVLLDDNEHSYEYVIRMVQELFHHPLEKAFKIAQRVDKDGRAVCCITHREHAELKREQILAFGRDALIPTCKGSMSAIIEPAWSGGDDDADDDDSRN